MFRLGLPGKGFADDVIGTVHGDFRPGPVIGTVHLLDGHRGYFLQQLLFERAVSLVEPVPLVLRLLVIPFRQVLLLVGNLSLDGGVQRGDGYLCCLEEIGPGVFADRTVFRCGPMAKPQRVHDTLPAAMSGTVQRLVDAFSGLVDTLRHLARCLVDGVGDSLGVGTSTLRHNPLPSFGCFALRLLGSHITRQVCRRVMRRIAVKFVSQVLARSDKALPCLVEQVPVDARRCRTKRHHVRDDVTPALRRVQHLLEPHVIAGLDIGTFVTIPQTISHGYGIGLCHHHLCEYVAPQTRAVTAHAPHGFAELALELYPRACPGTATRYVVQRLGHFEPQGFFDFLVFDRGVGILVIVHPVLGYPPVFLRHLPFFDGDVVSLVGTDGRGSQRGSGQYLAKKAAFGIVYAALGIALCVSGLDHDVSLLAVGVTNLRGTGCLTPTDAQVGSMFLFTEGNPDLIASHEAHGGFHIAEQFRLAQPVSARVPVFNLEHMRVVRQRTERDADEVSDGLVVRIPGHENLQRLGEPELGERLHVHVERLAVDALLLVHPGRRIKGRELSRQIVQGNVDVAVRFQDVDAVVHGVVLLLSPVVDGEMRCADVDEVYGLHSA
nr:MAG TPA: hypothetical protein [Caudoviricetes sp.]